GVEDPPCFEREERAQPLAATEGGVPDGAQQARLRPLLTGQEPVEGGMDPLGGVLQARFKLGHGALPLTERPAGASTPRGCGGRAAAPPPFIATHEKG